MAKQPSIETAHPLPQQPPTPTPTPPQPSQDSPPPWIASAIEVCAAIVDGDSNRRILHIQGNDPAAQLLHLINDILDHNEGFMREAIAALQSAIDGRTYRKVQAHGTHGDHLRALTGIQHALTCIETRSAELQLAEATRSEELRLAEASRANMAASVSETIQVVETLANEAKNISQFSSVIGNIASQTKMLALNAKIEAFRVGEAGRGFAVVAEEVKQLSFKASKTTTQIDQKLSAIQDATLRANNAISSIRQTLDANSTPTSNTPDSHPATPHAAAA